MFAFVRHGAASPRPCLTLVHRESGREGGWGGLGVVETSFSEQMGKVRLMMGQGQLVMGPERRSPASRSGPEILDGL